MLIAWLWVSVFFLFFGFFLILEVSKQWGSAVRAELEFVILEEAHLSLSNSWFC